MRRAGILLHPTSFPGPYGVGDLGPVADRFLEACASAGVTLWQVLPVGPTAHGDSPYDTLSAFAGNPMLISPERLSEDDLLDLRSLEPQLLPSASRVDYAAAGRLKSDCLRRAWRVFDARRVGGLRDAFEAFVSADEQRGWLRDWCRFAALKRANGGRAWLEWDASVEPDEDEVAYQAFVQFVFFRQWERLRAEARRQGIALLGDVPIYVALDSADVWSHRDAFDLDPSGRPLHVAGVPPDYFSETGQRWGNPLYRWDRMAESEFAWWVARIRANARRTDLVRLDHFRGFAGYWEIPAAEATAARGCWRPGPGAALFEALRRGLGALPLIAEDLGVITPDVTALRKTFGIPGMRVLQFGFGADDGGHLPHRWDGTVVAYTGTHDNDTTRGWFDALPQDDRARVLEYTGSTPAEVVAALVRVLFASVAESVVVPMQDLLELGSEARMNVPGLSTGNWTWRLTESGLAALPVDRIRGWATLTGRLCGPKGS